MANRRMISGTIATSETVNGMSEWAQLAYCFALPHNDDFGIKPGSPAKLKAIIKPLSDRPISDFAAAAAEWIAAGCEQAYIGDDDRIYLRAVNFERYQSGLHKRTKSRYPDAGRSLSAQEYLTHVSGRFPEVPGSSGTVTGSSAPTEQNRTEGNGREKNGSEQAEKPSSDSQAKSDSVIPSGLQEGADYWNGIMAPAWAKPKVTPKTLRKVADKYKALEREMLSEHPEWSLTGALKVAFETLPGLRNESWFRFSEFLFKHDYHTKNRNLWTGFYESMYGSPRLGNRKPTGHGLQVVEQSEAVA